MSGIRAGNIYYTVGIDKASLAALKKEVKAIGDSAKSSSQGLASINPELAKLAAKSTDVSNRMRTLNNDFKGNRRESQEFKDGMRALGVEAGRLRDEVAALGPDIVNSDRAMALASGTTSKLAGVMTQAAQVTGNMGKSSEMLGTEVVELMRYIDAINTEIRTLADELAVGAITTNQFSASMEKQKTALATARTQFEKMNTSVDKTDGSTKQLRDTQRKLSITTRLMSNETAKATGRINQMAMAKKLSYGATTLLNDRIFQLSPALGILTNQLIFTTNGFKAFLRAAAPIVAVAGAIIGAVTGIVASIRSGIGLEQALADVRKTTNLTNMELRALTNTFQDVAKRLPSTTLELLEIARVAGQLGITGAANIEKFTVAVAELSIATDVVGEEGATSLARFLQATGTATEQLGDIAGQVGNILNELENTTAATASEILQMTSYTQGLASQAGATRPEILGLNAALLSLGVKAEAGGSAVVRTISKMQVAAVQGGDSFQRFADVAGLSVEEFQRIVDDSPVEALLALARGMKASADEGANLNQVLIDLGINEVRERRALLALAQGAETFADAMDTANTEALEMLSLQGEVEIMSNTVGARLKMLGSRFATRSQELSQHTLPLFSRVLVGLIGIVDALTGLTGALNWAVSAVLELAGFPKDLSKEMATLSSSMERAELKVDSAKAAIVEMTNVTGKNGLIGVLQDFAATLDVDARGALARFVESTVQPLLAQGKLQEATSETIAWFVRMGATAAQESLSAMQSIHTLTASRLADESGHMPALRRMRGELLEAPQTPGIKKAIREIDERIAAYGELQLQVMREAEEIRAIQEEVEFYENAVEELGQMTSVEEMRAWIAENFGAGRTRITDTGEPDGAGGGDGGKSPLEEIMRSYREESNFLIAMMEDQGSTIEAQRAQAQGALENAQKTKEALYRLLSSEDLDPTLVSGIFDAISDMNQVISNLGVVDPLADAVAWAERLAAEVRFGYKTAQEAADLISPRLEQLEEEAATALDEFSIDSVQYQDALNKIDVLKAALEEIGEIEPPKLPTWSDPQADRRAMDRERARNRQDEQERINGLLREAAMLRDQERRGAAAAIRVGVYEEQERINDLLKEAAMLSDQERRASMGAAAAARVEQNESLARAQLGMQEDRRRMASARFVANYFEEQAEAELLAQARSRTRNAELDEEAARRGSLAQSMVQNYQDEQDALQRLEDIATNYASALEDISGMKSHGLITNLEAIEMQARAAEGRMLALAAETGWASSETTAAVAAYNELREELLAATEVWGKYGDGVAYTISAIEQTEGPFNSVGEAILAIGEYIPVTAEMVDYLNERFGETGDSVGSAEEAIADYAERMKELGALFAFGIIDQVEYVQGTISALETKFRVLSITAGATEEELLALANQIKELKILLGELGSTGGLEEFLQTDGVKIALSALQEASALLPGFQSKGNDIFGAFVGVASTVADTLVPGLGQVVSIIGDAINKVLDLSNGMEEVAEVVDKAADSSRYISRGVVEGFRDIEGMVFREKRGGFLGWLGLTKAAINEDFFELALSAAEGFANGFAGALRDGIKAAMDGERDWKKVFRESFHEAIINAVLDTFIETAMLTAGLQKTMAEFARIMVEDGPGAAFAYLEGELPGIYAEAEYWINEAADLVPDAFKKGEESAKETLERIKDNLIEQGGVLSEDLVGTLIRLATSNGLVDEAALNTMVSIAKSIADGFESGLRSGINAFLEGNQDWKEELREGIKSTIVSGLIDAFIASSAVNAIAADFVEGFLEAFKDPNRDAAQWAADNIGNALGEMSNMIETFVSSIPRELLPSSNPRSTAYRPPEPPTRNEPTKTNRAAGTNISEITGPTRDLLIDLLTPLSIMPSWTSMIRDIRNDVRAMASGSGFSGTIQVAPMMGAAQTNISIQNLTVTTQARDARSLFRELSEYAYNERRGGK